MAATAIITALCGLAASTALAAPTVATAAPNKAKATPSVAPAVASPSVVTVTVVLGATKKPSATSTKKPAVTTTTKNPGKSDVDKAKAPKCPPPCVFLVNPATDKCVVYRNAEGGQLGMDDCNVKANVEGHGRVANPAVVTVRWSNNTLVLCNDPAFRLATPSPQGANGSTIGKANIKNSKFGFANWTAVASGNSTQLQATGTGNCWSASATGAITLQPCKAKAPEQMFAPTNRTSCPPPKNDDCKLMSLGARKCVLVNPEERNTTTPSLVMGNCSSPYVIFTTTPTAATTGLLPVRFNKTDMCIGSNKDSDSAGSKLTLRQCKSDRKTNQWSESNGVFTNGLGLCMAPAGKDGSGALLQVACNGTSAGVVAQLTSSCKLKF